VKIIRYCGWEGVASPPCPSPQERGVRGMVIIYYSTLQLAKVSIHWLIEFLSIENQLERIAATGSNLAAIAAGTIPDTKPITVDTPRPSTIFFTVSTTSKLPIGI
jgi:hypothetical protein